MRQPEGKRQSDCRADRGQDQPASDDEPEDITRSRAERQPNADLARPLRYKAIGAA
jgi:hypothetical protein